MSITEYLRQNRQNGVARFYMPGHKGKLKLDAYDDITEIVGADSLYEAQGIIRQAERRTSELYGSYETVYSAGGTTLCIQGMLAAAQRHYGFRKIAAARNAHISFVNACALLDLLPVWMMPESRDGFGVSGRLTPAQLEQTLAADREIGAVYVTSPDYFGVLSDIRGLAEVCRQYGVPLLVDNAHGAHLKVLRKGLHPLEQGAAMCCDGAHKTLPVLTGGAYLHTAAEISAEELKAGMALFGSTSPSYLILQSLDACNDFLEIDAADAFERMIRRLELAREAARAAGLFVFDSEPARISLGGRPKNFDGTLAEYFHRCRMEYDYAAGEAVVLMPSPFNLARDFDRLELSLCQLKAEAAPETLGLSEVPIRVMEPREAVFRNSESVPVEDCLGRVAAQAQIHCPPGVAVVVPGEMIGQNEQRILKNSGIFTVKVVI